MLCSETLREAIQMGCQYQKVPGRFSGRLVFLSLRTEGDEAVLEVKAAVAPDDLVLFAVEDMLGSILSVTRWVAAGPCPCGKSAAAIRVRPMASPTASTCPARWGSMRPGPRCDSMPPFWTRACPWPAAMRPESTVPSAKN